MNLTVNKCCSVAQSCPTLCDLLDSSTPGFLSFTISWILLKLMSIESVMSSNHIILCHPLLLLSSIFPSIRVFFHKSAYCSRCPKYWSLSFSISPSNEYSELISFRIDWFDLLAVQETLESSPAPQFESINPLTLSLTYGPTLTSILDYWKSHSFEYMDLCCKVMSLLFNTLSRYFSHSYSMNHVRKMKCICAPLSHDRL